MILPLLDNLTTSLFGFRYDPRMPAVEACPRAWPLLKRHIHQMAVLYNPVWKDIKAFHSPIKELKSITCETRSSDARWGLAEDATKHFNGFSDAERRRF
jgi:hypothetical protein